MSTKYNCIRWAFDLSQWRPSLSELAIATACLQAEEKSRLMKFHFRDDFDASLIGRLLMRKFVRDTVQIDYEKILFGRDSRGKPFLVNSIGPAQQIDFNVSHQGDFSVLAGIVQTAEGDDTPSGLVKIGVDTMKIEYSGGKPLTEFFRLMTRNFSPDEWTFIRGRGAESEQLRAFMRLWCLKESYVKNLGVGITVDLQKISFKTVTEVVPRDAVITDTRVVVDDCLQTEWTFEEHLLDDGHCAAIAFKNMPAAIAFDKFKVLKFDELIDGAVLLADKDIAYCQSVMKKKYK